MKLFRLSNRISFLPEVKIAYAQLQNQSANFGYEFSFFSMMLDVDAMFAVKLTDNLAVHTGLAYSSYFYEEYGEEYLPPLMTTDYLHFKEPLTRLIYWKLGLVYKIGK